MQLSVLFFGLPARSVLNDPKLCFKILIVSGYKVQAHEMRAMAEELKTHAIPEGIIDIRTVDDSPSFEAEVVIYDLPRSSHVSFLGNPEPTLGPAS
ncbi:hypothetical protein NQ176_g3718 [Zarea fungicola]|uniref:Uncharacterized protein n=1 Tax=Zarea fungicola TaxID=93591 RepID=A0ACC1NJA8_9HYPO|nr:hypothetical protein NQ176_g3718 [Lecanicillium fungicola]